MKSGKWLKKSLCKALIVTMVLGNSAGAGGITAYGAGSYELQVDASIEAAKSLASLPSSPNFVEQGQSIQTPKEVEWSVKSGSFLDAGSKVTAQYKIKENSQIGTTPVIAIPDHVVYLVECNRAADAAGDFKRLKEKGNSSALKNTVPDQIYTEGSWGYIDNNYNKKGLVPELNDTKGNTGYYGGGDAGITYKLPLEAGTYTVSAPIYEWWGSYGRSVEVIAEFTKEGVLESKLLGTGKPANKFDCVWVEGSFTVDTDQTISLHFKKPAGSGQEAVVSGFTVIKTDEELPTPDGSIQVTLDGNEVDPVNTFGGFGAVTCNNTSRLLMDYKEDSPEQYWEMMKLLFDVEEGAGLHHVKIEMGADVNSSSGTEPATMRSPDEEPNVKRGAGFHFAADAKTINPHITVELLRWGEPKWTQEGIGYEDAENPRYEARYQWYRQTIDAVYETYGYKIDEVSPGQNERRKDHADDFAWIKYCAKRFDEDGAAGVGAYDYRDIKIVAADLYRGMGTTVDYLKNDEEFRELVDVISDHYAVNLGSADLTKLNQEDGIRVIYGEGIAPMINANYRYHVEPERGGVGGSTGMADLAERFIAAYAYKSATGHPSRMTSFLYQPAIGAFYEGSAYSPKQLIGAFDPWSGYYEADGGLQMTRHFMLFADQDWQYMPDACYADGSIGDGGMNYNTSTDVRLALKDPETDDYSMMFANNTATERKYTITLKNLATGAAPYHVWETAGPQTGEAFDSGWFQKVVDGAVPVNANNENSTITLTVKPHSIVTLTTLTDRGTPYEAGSNTAKHADGTVIERSVLELPYRDDFDYTDEFVAERGGTPKYTTDLEGAFEVVKAEDAPGYVLQQSINNDNRPYNWNPWGSGSDESSQTTGTPWTVLGDHRWANYVAGIDFKLDTTSNGYGDNFAVLGVRELVHSSGAAYRGRIYADGTWQILRFGNIQADGKIADFQADSWHKMQMEAKENVITLYLDGEKLGEFTDNTESAVLTGRVTLMSGFWNTDYDNLEVLPLEGTTPYAQIKADNTSPLLTFRGDVSHAVGEGFAHYNRTRTTMKTGSTLEFELPDGSGFDIFGSGSGASIKIEHKGSALEENYSAKNTGNRETSYWNQGDLGSGTVKITVLSGNYVVDGINMFAAKSGLQTELITESLQNMIIYAEGLTFDSEKFPPQLVERVAKALEQAKVVIQTATTQMELDMAALEIRNAVNGVIPGDTIIGIEGAVEDIVVTLGDIVSLPETITVKNAMGNTIEAAVTWEVDEAQLEEAWRTVTATASVEGTDKKLSVDITVVPAGLTHYIDSGTTGVKDGEGNLSHSAIYDKIASAIDLENKVSDKIYSDGSWGYVNDSMSIKSADSVNYNTDMYTSGLYVGAGKDIIYKVPLKAGTYTVMTGYQAYWNEQRTMNVFAVSPNGNGGTTKKELGQVTVNTSNNNIFHKGTFEVAADGIVEIHAGKASGSKDPILSWLAIIDEKKALENGVTVNDTLPLIVEKSAAELPEKVNVTFRGEEKEIGVDWKLKSGDLKKTGSVVTFEGRSEEIPGKKLTWSPVVYSKNQVFFIDSAIMTASGSPQQSDIFDAVAERTELKHDAPDQPAEGNDWGYAGIDGSKAYEEGYGLHGAGFYGANPNGSSFTYQLMLDSGDYQINTGHTEWWTQNRTTEVTASYEGENGVIKEVLGSAGWNTNTRWSKGEVQGQISIPKDQTQVTLTFTAKANNQGAVVSYVAVEKIPEVKMEGIQIQKKPNKLIYKVGEDLDTTGMVVVALRSNAEPLELTKEQYQVSGFDSSKEGEYEVVVSAVSETGETFTDSFKVQISELEYFTTKIKVTTKPDKTVYFTDEEFNAAGMVVKAVKKATASNATPIEEEVEDYEVEYDFTQPGTSKVAILYTDENLDGEMEEFTASIDVQVKVRPVEDEYYTTRIRIDKKPNKLVYKPREEFEPEGMKVKAVQKASPSNATRELELELDELDYKYDFSNPGNQKVTVVYMGVDKNQDEKEFKTTLEVKVAASEESFDVNGLKVTRLPNKTVYYVGEAFDATGMVVKAQGINPETGESMEKEITDYTVSTTLFMLAGKRPVEVSYTVVGQDGSIRTLKDKFFVTVKHNSNDDSDSSDNEDVMTVPSTYITYDTMQGDWKQDEKGWWLRKKDGTWPKNEWARINGVWYFFHQDGYMATNWVFSHNQWYYLNENGAMMENTWVFYKDQWYYLGKEGVMAKGTKTPDGYRVDENGALIK